MHKQKKLNMILIVGETIEGRLTAGSKYLGRQARELAGTFDGNAVGVLTGHRIDDVARKWSEMAGMPVTVLDHSQYRYPNPPLTVAGLEAMIDDDSPAAVCFSHSLRACQCSATLARGLGVSCIAGVESLVKKGAFVTLKRSIYGGRFTETLTAETIPLILTVMPGAVSVSISMTPSDFSPSVETRYVKTAEDRFRPTSFHRSTPTDQGLHKAQVVVAGGRGLGGSEYAGLLETVAGIFKNAAVGGSRGACDQGWLPHLLQIGETGQTVAPPLYLACGISGAPQHLAGMRESQTIVAINTEPKAAILNVARYAVIDDLKIFLPELVERYEKKVIKGEANER